MRYLNLFTLTVLAACVEEPQDGRSAYMENCASCHAADATGNGPDARALGVIAPDLTGLATRNGGTFPRDQVMSIIDGLSRDPHFSAAMPEFGAGDLGDTVVVEQDGLGTPVPLTLLLLTDYLEDIQK